MADDDDNPSPGARLSGAAKQARDAADSAREYVANADLDGLRSKAADVAGRAYRKGQELLDSDEFADAKDQLTESIRRNPLAAVGIAFTAGLVLALLTRG